VISPFIPLLVNQYEQATFGEIQRMVDGLGLTVWIKVRVADVLPIDRRRTPPELFSYGLKSHFDFLICRDMQPEYAVEFDGPYHRRPEQALNDRKKNALCKTHGFPLLRIDSRHIERKYQQMSLLAWIMEVRETEIAFDEAQRKGLIPYDEPFDPLSIWRAGDRLHPFWLSRHARVRWQSLAESGQIRDMCSSGGQWHHDETMYGIEFIRVTRQHGIHVATWMRLQDFPEMPTLFEEMLCIRLDEQLDLYFAGKRSLEPLAEINAKVKRFDTQYKMGRRHSFSRGDSS
jgi:Protein of unknown function (DUF2726)